MNTKFQANYKIKNYIYFDKLKGKFLVPKHNLKSLFKKGIAYNISDIQRIKLVTDTDYKDTILGTKEVCIEVCLMIVLPNDDRCYIDFLDKPTFSNSLKCKKAYKDAQEVISALKFMQKVGEYQKQRKISKEAYLLPRILVPNA